MTATYLLTWNPAKYDWPKRELTSFSRRSAARKPLRFSWSCGKSMKPRKGDRVFLTKLGSKPRGVFASGVLLFDATFRGENDWGNGVEVDWDTFLDPRDADNLLDPQELPDSALQQQMWTPQMSGIVVRPGAAAVLEELWRAHCASRHSRIEDPPKLVTHTFRLRKDLDIAFSLPPNLTHDEADRLGDFIRTLVLEPRANSGDEHSPGVGPSTSSPRGRRVSLPPGVALVSVPRGGARNGPRIGSGAGHVDVGLSLRAQNGSSSIVLPAGFVMVAKNTAFQNGLVVQEVRIEIPANSSAAFVLAMYCLNKTRKPADETTEFIVGPVIEDPALLDLFTLLRGKNIPFNATSTIQEAVWEISDGTGLSPTIRRALRSL